jgi:hypothetical protein
MLDRVTTIKAVEGHKCLITCVNNMFSLPAGCEKNESLGTGYNPM